MLDSGSQGDLISFFFLLSGLENQKQTSSCRHPKHKSNTLSSPCRNHVMKETHCTSFFCTFFVFLSRQGDWCHSNRLTSCSNRCCSKCLASRPRHRSLAETGSLRVWKRCSGRRAAVRVAVPSSLGTPAPARPPSCGGWWRSALKARTHRRRAPVRPNVSITCLHAAVLCQVDPQSLVHTATSGFWAIGGKKTSVLSMQPVTRLHTHLSSPPQWLPCWLQLCNRTKSVFLLRRSLLAGKTEI